MKTGASDEFKNLEMEMNLRHEGTIPSSYLLQELSLMSYYRCRNGETPQVNESLRAIGFCKEGGRCQGEDAAN